MMGELLTLLCVLLAANLDTIFLAMGWTLRQKRFTIEAMGMIAAVTTAATWLALFLGGWAAHWLTVTTAKKAGGALLLGMGVWTVIDALRERPAEETAMPMRWGECLTLSLALAGNNMGLGLGAGLGGSDPLLAALCNCAITLLALAAGGALGRRAAKGWLHQYGPMLSGVILILMGALEPWV